MRKDGRRSSNVDDRRGGRRVAAAAGVPLGCGTLLLIVVYLVLGGDPAALVQLLDAGQQTQTRAPRPAPRGDAEDALADFASVVLADTEEVWGRLFAASGARYPEPTLVLFEEEVRSACGFASAAVGPFYCPADSKVYIDLGFYRELHQRFRAPGDFAQAYVLAHEIGHHVQNVVGTMAEVQRAQQRLPKAESNALSVRLELQADCYAGIWAHHAQQQRQILEEGDLEEALRAASAIGDDNIQRMTQGYVVPESFTHGSARQRVDAFTRGLKSGRIDACSL